MNLQNLPREDKTVKQAFVPKLDAFLFADYKAIEYRMLAFYLSKIGYPAMAQQFRDGLDPHMATAAQLGISDRNFGKTFNFASIYGAGAKTLKDMLIAEGMMVSFPHAKGLLADFHRLNPGVRALSWPEPRFRNPEVQWIPGRIEDELGGKGYIHTLWGRELHPIPYRALNALIQGCSADLLRASMVNVHHMLASMQSHLVMSVHDELIIDCKADELKFIAANLPDWMTDERIANVVPIGVDLEVSHTTWAEKTAWDSGC